MCIRDRIKTFADLKEAIAKRMEHFNSMGCCISDHGLDYVMYAPATEEEVEAVFAQRLAGKEVSKAVSYTHLDVYKRQE